MKKPLSLLKLTLLAIASAVVSSALPVGAQSVWNATIGVSANTNWSTAGNWLPVAVPDVSSNVLFVDTANTAPGSGSIDNVVDQNTSIQQLSYRQTNGVHNTLILHGVTLTITNMVGATNFFAGTDFTNSPSVQNLITNTISGAGGTLDVIDTNIASVICVRQLYYLAGSHNSVLDMSGLDNFNATVGKVWVGVFPSTGTTRPQGVLYLARTNNITALAGGTKLAPAIDVGDTLSSPDVGNILSLGISNNIAADTIAVGNERSGGTLNFNSAFTNITTPTLYLRGYTNSRVSTFNIGDNSSATANIGSACSGVVNFSGGTINAMVDSMTLGDGQTNPGTGTGIATGTLTMTAGTFDVNTLEVAYQGNIGVTSTNTGTVNINGGTLTVNTSLRLAFYGGSGGLSRGTLNITNGTVRANDIVAGGGTCTINLSGGTLIVTNTIGSLAHPLSALNVNNGEMLQFSVVNGVTPCEVTTLSGDSSGLINISSLPAIASYPQTNALITYQAGSGSGVAFSLNSMPGTSKGYVYNDASSTIWLVVTNGPSLTTVKWGGGVNNLWDTSTLNWTNNGVAVKFQNLDVVTFDDSAKTNNVNVTGTFTNGAWIQNNNTKNYTFIGVGSIIGEGGLVMNGSATLTLADTGGDNISGGVVVNAGTVILDDANSVISGGLTIAGSATAQIGNNDANGALPSGTLGDDGTLIFKRTDNVLVDTAISGGGALIQNGSGTLFLSVSNTYTGSTTVTAGTLALTNSGSIANSTPTSVTGATLDVSAMGTTTLATLNLNNASLNMAVVNLQPNLNVISLNLGGAGNTINVSSLPPLASYPTTVTLIQSVSSISGFNMTIGSLPSTYQGYIALGGGNTAVLLTLTNGPVGVRPIVTWGGADAIGNVNTNWSDNNNWQMPGAPVPSDIVVFNNTAAAATSDLSTAGGGASALIPGSFNNIVDRNFTVASLTYTNNGGTYHNTGITNGATLNVTNVFTVGAVDAGSTLQQEFVNFAGSHGATLNVNNTNSNLQVWVGATGSGGAASFAALDLSALENFIASVSKLTVGACAVNNAVNRPSGILYLARTNTIACAFQTATAEVGSTTGNSAIVLGDCNQNQGLTSYIYLGQANTISADTIGIRRQKASGRVLFNQIYSNTVPYPTVTFTGFSSSQVSIFSVGDGVGNTGTKAGTGSLNLNGGFVTATVDTMNIGRAGGGAAGLGTTTGTLDFDAGTITANTVNIGFQPATGTNVGVGTVNVGTNTIIATNARLVVGGNLNLGVNVGDIGAATTAGTLNIDGGTVWANNIMAGTNGATSTINLNSGVLIVTNIAGTAAAPLTALNLLGGTLQLSVDGSSTVTNVVATTVGISGTTPLVIGSVVNILNSTTVALISYTGSDPYSSLSLKPLPTGYAGTLIDDTAKQTIDLHITPPPSKPTITKIGVTGTKLTINATNGTFGGQYKLLSTTNVALSLSLWTPILTNHFDGSGNLNLSTNIINPAVPRQFYILLQ